MNFKALFKRIYTSRNVIRGLVEVTEYKIFIILEKVILKSFFFHYIPDLVRLASSVDVLLSK